jgi:shikimate kinase
MAKKIILIGPSAAGKSTVAALLGERLGLPVVELDDVRWRYYEEIRYDHDYARKLRREQGFEALVAYWQPFSMHALERVLQDYSQRCIISTGAGAVVFTEPDYFNRTQALLIPHDVVLIVPSADLEETIQILTMRFTEKHPEWSPDALMRVNRQLLQHPAYFTLATITVLNKDQTPEQTCQTILPRLQG